MSTRRFGLLAGVLLLVGAVPNAQPQTNAARQLMGTWRLVSWIERLADGTTRSNMFTGYLMYTDENRMCAVITDPKAPKWDDARRPTGAEAVSGFAGLTAYCGTYDVNMKEGFIVHHVDVEARPNLVGIERRRVFTLEGKNRLTLRVEPSEIAGVASTTLAWERVETPSANASSGQR